jgi:hypothetical protein
MTIDFSKINKLLALFITAKNLIGLRSNQKRMSYECIITTSKRYQKADLGNKALQFA